MKIQTDLYSVPLFCPHSRIYGIFRESLLSMNFKQCKSTCVMYAVRALKNQQNFSSYRNDSRNEKFEVRQKSDIALFKFSLKNHYDCKFSSKQRFIKPKRYVQDILFFYSASSRFTQITPLHVCAVARNSRYIYVRYTEACNDGGTQGTRI